LGFTSQPFVTSSTHSGVTETASSICVAPPFVKWMTAPIPIPSPHAEALLPALRARVGSVMRPHGDEADDIPGDPIDQPIGFVFDLKVMRVDMAEIALFWLAGRRGILWDCRNVFRRDGKEKRLILGGELHQVLRRRRRERIPIG